MNLLSFIAALILSAPVFAELSSARLTPAEQELAVAENAVRRDAADARNYVALAFAHAKRARETADPAHYADAATAVERALELAPENYQALKAKAWVLLGRHEFQAALKVALELNRRVPDDVQVYGFLVDAYVELGDYDEAERAAQWMLDLRPGNIAGLTRAAYLRELFGDVEGAVELFEMAYTQVLTHEVEDRAWILTHIAHLRLATGEVERAERVLDEALALFPDYHYALAQMAKVRAAQGRHDDAAELYERRYRIAPHPENLFDLAKALEHTDRAGEAESLLLRFEELAGAESTGFDNANRELIRHYAERGLRGDPAAAGRALELATVEAERRHDVHTLDALAWALYASGQPDQARVLIEDALAVGIDDAEMSYRAGVIAEAQGDAAAARKHFRESRRRNPRSSVADDVERRLAALAASER